MAPRRNYLDEDEPKYRCCCNTMHVERGTYIIAIFGLVLTGLAAIVYLLTMNITAFFMCLVYMASYLCIFWAQQRHKPGLYLPFLVIEGIALVVIVGFMIFILFPLFVIYFNVGDQLAKDPKKEKDLYTTLILSFLFVLLSFMLSAWFYIVVYRAYKYMKEVKHSTFPSSS